MDTLGQDDLHAQFFGHADALRDQDDLFADLYETADPAELTVSSMRRRRRRLVNEDTDVVKTVSLVDEGGVLYWRNGIPAQPPGRTSRRRRAARGRRRGLEPETAIDDRVVLTRDFPVLAPNKVTQAIVAIDRRLNSSIDDTMGSRLRRLERRPDGTFEVGKDIEGPFDKGKTLVLVHGTFSNATSMLGEFAVEPGAAFLARAFKAYERVVFFDHPTLAVSPILNALELARLVGASTAPVDVIAHSRGGLVVRWWLEAFGAGLKLGPKSPVRVVFAGSPLYGTSLAAPDKIKNAMDLLSNIGTLAQVTLNLVGAANPFLWVAGKLIEVFVSIVGALAKTPIVDAGTALIPGLSAQSAVSNNLEMQRLRRGPSMLDPHYFAIMSNFETEDPRWRFWRNFRKQRLMDLAADVIFPGENDLVVDTSSMTQLGVKGLKLAGKACDFGTSDSVWHCNYFRQERAIKYIGDTFQV